MRNEPKIGQVVTTSPTSISVQVMGLETLESNKDNLQIGKFLKVEDGNHNFAVVVIINISGSQLTKSNDTTSDRNSTDWEFLIETNPIGALIKTVDGIYQFRRGAQVLPVPTEPVYILSNSDFGSIYSHSTEYNYKIGNLLNNSNVGFFVDGDKFFGKHIGIVGSTGSGKSCAVSSLIQSIVGIKDNNNIYKDNQKNSHIVILDIHAEYQAAFKLSENNNFCLNYLSVDNIALPYWLMNSDELESVFLDTSDGNKHNQISQFKKAVILNKERHNNNLKVTYDTPCYFSIEEVLNYIKNKNSMTTYIDGESVFLAINEKLRLTVADENLWETHKFLDSTGNGKHPTLGKISRDSTFYGEFDKFISRLETKLEDRRLDFLLCPKIAGKYLNTGDFTQIITQLIGYSNKSNISIVDLSGIPFELMNITISLISRIIFDFSFHYSRIQHAEKHTNQIPFMLVCEEAHNYIPRESSQDYKASKRAIERIAKEGRKYGLSLMVVSQRPSEVSETIFSQCSNFLTLRLTNANDQNYIKSLLNDASSNLVDILPSLGQGEALIVGDAVVMPSIVKLPEPNPPPQSASVRTYMEWTKSWKEETFEKVVSRWNK